MLVQLNPPLPLDTPEGPAIAHFVIDYGPEHDLLWVCFLRKDRRIWCYGNRDVLANKNLTFHRPSESAGHQQHDQHHDKNAADADTVSVVWSGAPIGGEAVVPATGDQQ